MLRKFYDALVSSRLVAPVLTAIRRLPPWLQIVVWVLIGIAGIVLGFFAFDRGYVLLACPPEEPQCGPWETVRPYLHL
jgi:hypothetical protein